MPKTARPYVALAEAAITVLVAIRKYRTLYKARCWCCFRMTSTPDEKWPGQWELWTLIFFCMAVPLFPHGGMEIVIKYLRLERSRFYFIGVRAMNDSFWRTTFVSIAPHIVGQRIYARKITFLNSSRHAGFRRLQDQIVVVSECIDLEFDALLWPVLRNIVITLWYFRF